MSLSINFYYLGTIGAKISIIILFIILVSFDSHSQTTKWLVSLDENVSKLISSKGYFLIEKGGQAFAVDTNGLRHTIDLEFDQIVGVEGKTIPYIKYNDNNLRGLLSLDNESLLPPVYENINSLNNQCFVVSKYNLNAVVDKNNNLILPYRPKVGYIRIDDSTFAKRLNRSYVIYSNKGDSLSTTASINSSRLEKLETHYFDRNDQGKIGMINNDGDTLIRHEYAQLEPFGESLIIAITKRRYKYGVFNIDGEEVLPLTYSRISREEPNEKFVVTTKNNKYNALNYKGELLFDKDITSITTLSPNRMLTKESLPDGSSTYYLKDENGKLVSSLDYENIHANYDGQFMQAYKDKKSFILSKEGKVLKESDKRMSVTQEYSDNRYVLDIGRSKYIFVDSNMEQILQDTFYTFQGWKFPEVFQTYDRKTNKYELRNMLGKVVLTYDVSAQFQRWNNLLLIKRKEKVGLIDKKGKFVLDLKYDEIRGIGKGLYKVKLSEHYGIFKVAIE